MAARSPVCGSTVCSRGQATRSFRAASVVLAVGLLLHAAGCRQKENAADPSKKDAASAEAPSGETAANGSAPEFARARVQPRSNILLIIADDVGTDKVGVYMEGDDRTRPKTPNIDALAADGVRFVNAYANPFCSPTRATLLTGQYSFRTGIGSIIHEQAEVVLPLFPAQVPIPIMLKLGGAGYDHSQVGKWHLASERTGGPGNPLQHGFNWTAGSARNLRTGCQGCNYYSWMKQVNGVVSRVEIYATTDTTNDAIERANQMPEPWFMWLAYNAAHKPRHVPPAHLHHQPDPEGDDVLMYAAMVEALDTEIGRLLASMEPARLANTTIIFLGDNGHGREVVPPPYNKHPRKGSVSEGGINVPFIVSGPHVPASSRGRTSKALVNSTDVYATVADIAGVNLSEVLPPGVELDSVSLLPLLGDPDRTTAVRRYAYVEKFQPNGPGPYDHRQRAIRDGRWKLIRRYGPNSMPAFKDLLFDLDQAPPGLDGDDLCLCPEKLSGEALAAYERLSNALVDLGGP